MDAIALSVAAVIVALVARDVALRWMAGKREIDGLRVECADLEKHFVRTVQEEAARRQVALSDRDQRWAAIDGQRLAAIEALTTQVSTLKTTLDMRDGMRRS